MEEKVKSILDAEFPGIEVETEVLPGGRISGHVIWAGFAGMDEVERQTRIRGILKEKLGEEAQQVGILFTFTPDELKAMKAA